MSVYIYTNVTYVSLFMRTLARAFWALTGYPKHSQARAFGEKSLGAEAAGT